MGSGLSDLNAQSKFFQPIDQVVKENPVAKGEGDNYQFHWRPTVSLNAYAVNLNDTDVTTSFTSAGIGVSYGKYSIVNDKAYCTFSVNGLLMTSVKIGDTTETDFGLGVTVDVFDKFIGIGTAYIGKDFLLASSYLNFILIS